MYSVTRAKQATGLFILILVVSMSRAEESPHNAGLTDYQRMSWLFYLANQDEITTAAAAIHFGILHTDIANGSNQCAKTSQMTDHEVTEVHERYQSEFDALRNSIKPEQLSNRFSVAFRLSNAYDRFDKTSGTLVLKGFEQLRNPYTVGPLSSTQNIPGFIPCNTLSTHRIRPGASTIIPMPERFRIDQYLALQKAIMPGVSLTTLADVHESSQLSHIPMEEEFALQLLNRPSIEKNLDMLIEYQFQPRRPFQETDAYGRRNQLIHTSHTTFGFSLPTHAVQILNVTYSDKQSGKILWHTSFNESLMNIHRKAPAQQQEYISSDEFRATANKRNNGLPNNLRTHGNAIVVRTDDLVFHKTPAENRLALTKLNQLLALSAGLPDLTDPENGIYIADILGDRAAEYFTISDMRTVQPQTYNLLLDGADQGVLVATRWRDDIPKEVLLKLFREKEVPSLHNISLKFPIEFIELRDVLVQPYDNQHSGFPLLLINGGSNMRLNDLRKPTIRLDAALPGPIPTHWKLDRQLAEIFVERYYQFHAERDGSNFIGILKRITLASHYKMMSVIARNGAIAAEMKLLQRTLHLNDDLNQTLADLPITPTH